jgi:serine/threonine protein phosphatase PrpC
VRDPAFPSSPKKALRNGCLAAENYFIDLVEKQASQGMMLDKSGSCATCTMFVGKEISLIYADDVCYTANVGDSRIIMSADRGKICYELTKDHKPNDEAE